MKRRPRSPRAEGGSFGEQLAQAAGWAMGPVAGEWVRDHLTDRRRRRIEKSWGRPPVNKYDADELLLIKSWYEATRQGAPGEIDDVTWNDLDLDQVYARVNATLTSAGDGVLYRMLRCPLMRGEEVAGRAGRIAGLSGSRARDGLRLQLSRLGHDYRMNPDMLFNEEKLGNPGRYKRAVLQAAALAGLIGLCFPLPVMVLPALALFFVNVVTSMKARRDMEGDIPTVIWLMKLTGCARGLRAILDGAGLSEEAARIGGPLGRIKALAASPLMQLFFASDALLELFKTGFLLELIYYEKFMRDMSEKRAPLMALYAAVGELDALLAVGSYRAQQESWCVPHLDQAGGLTMEHMRHPLIAGAVPNPVALTGPLLLTGSNASGKSTYLKAVALGALMGQSLATCLAVSARGCCFQIFTSMALRDSVASGESYFVVEIRALKRILDYRGEAPCLAVIDEVLRGTNTCERISAAAAVMGELARRGVTCLTATHDGELCQLLGDAYQNGHFTEQLVNGRMSFDYRLRPGAATSRNAINLLEVMGYEPRVVERARALFMRYQQTGHWDEPEENKGG